MAPKIEHPMSVAGTIISILDSIPKADNRTELIERTYWANQFITRDDQPLNEFAAETAHDDPIMERWWKNHFVTIESGTRSTTSAEKKDLDVDAKSEPDETIQLCDDAPCDLRLQAERARKVEMEHRRFFITALCEVLGIKHGRLIALEAYTLRAVVDKAMWLKPDFIVKDKNSHRASFDFVVSKIDEIYGINAARVRAFADAAKSPRDFILTVITYDAEARDKRKRLNAAASRISLYGFDIADETYGSEPSTAPISSLAEPSPTEPAEHKLDRETPVPKSESSAPSASTTTHPRDDREMTLKCFTNSIRDSILPVETPVKKVTISITFEM